MARGHRSSLPRWTSVPLARITVPRDIGETIALAGLSLYPSERLDFVTEKGVWHLLRTHPVQCLVSRHECVGGLLTLQLARYHLDPSERIPVQKLRLPADVSETEHAAADLMTSLVVYGVGRPCSLEALVTVRAPIAKSDYARGLLHGLGTHAAFGRLVNRHRSSISTAVNSRRRAEGAQ